MVKRIFKYLALLFLYTVFHLFRVLFLFSIFSFLIPLAFIIGFIKKLDPHFDYRFLIKIYSKKPSLVIYNTPRGDSHVCSSKENKTGGKQNV